MQAIIIAGGKIENYSIIRRYIDSQSIIICADSGYDHAVAMNVRPHLVVGDMDSVKQPPSNVDIRRFPRRKDQTDTEIAAQAALSYPCSELLLIGATGNRLDHTLANLLLMKTIAEKNIPVRMADETHEIYVSCRELTLHATPGDLVSLIALQDCSGVCSKGLEYPLQNDVLTVGSSRGVSNVFTTPQAKITLKSGCLMAILPK